jgi:hypothetical protein
METSEKAPTEYQWRMEVYSQYLNVRQDIDNKKFDISLQLSKSIITLSAGTLAISMTLMSDIWPDSNEYRSLIYSWMFFAVSIILEIINLALIITALDKQADINDDYYKEILESSEAVSPANNPVNKWLIPLRILVLAAFLSGYYYLGSFVIYNMENGAA